MAPATEECCPVACDAEEATDPADDASAPQADSFCCCCCACWQRRQHRTRPPRGTDKVGGTERETLLSGGKTRFYCCEPNMTTRPGRGPNRVRNSTTEPIETAVAVNPGLCSLFKSRGRQNSDNDIGVPPVDFAFDALDERAYVEEFEAAHQEQYDITRTIANPIMPHSEILSHPSQVGRAIIIKGKVHPNAQGFVVNLVCREKHDIAMHFNPRLDRGYIARNTKLNGTWGSEENSLNGPSPFQSDTEFTLHILVAEEEYRFCHNGRHMCSYRHRVPIARLHVLDINGDLSVSMVKHRMVEEFPPAVPPVSMEDLTLDAKLLSVGHTPLLIPTTHSWRADIPKQSYMFLGRFQPNLSIGNEIIIGGNVRLLPHAFFINLQNGLQMWKSPEVHFHINPRFEDHNHTVINARLKGEWGYEERHSRCRFQPGRPFTLTIRIEKDRYRALVNGYVLASMDHRARPSEINSLYISGDVDITSIGFNTKLSTTKSTGSKKEVTIAEDSEWADLDLEEDSPSTKRRENPGSPVPEDLTSGKQILTLWKPGENADGLQQQGSIKPLLNGILPEHLQPSTSNTAGMAGSAGGALPVDTESPLQSGKKGSSAAISPVDSDELTNRQPLQLESDKNPAVSYATDSVETTRDSIVSDDIFLSAQHSLEPSLGSNRNSLDGSVKSELVSSTSKPKTDNDKKS